VASASSTKRKRNRDADLNLGYLPRGPDYRSTKEHTMFEKQINSYTVGPEDQKLAEEVNAAERGRGREIDLEVTESDLIAAASAGSDTVTLGKSSIRVTAKGPAQSVNMFSNDPGALESAPQVAQIDNQITYLTENLCRLADADGNIRPGNEAEAEKLERQIVQLQFSRAHQVHVASAGIRAAQRSGRTQERSRGA
jgi:hypothetical protein